MSYKRPQFIYTIEASDDGEVWIVEFNRKFARQSKREFSEEYPDKQFRIRQVPLDCGDFIR